MKRVIEKIRESKERKYQREKIIWLKITNFEIHQISIALDHGKIIYMHRPGCEMKWIKLPILRSPMPVKI